MRLRWMYVSQECDCLLCEMSVSHFDFTVRFGLDNLIEGFRCVIVWLLLLLASLAAIVPELGNYFGDYGVMKTKNCGLKAVKMFNVLVELFSVPRCLSFSPTLCAAQLTHRALKFSGAREDSLCGRDQGTWAGHTHTPSLAHTHTHSLAHTSPLPGYLNFRSYKRISQLEGAAFESHAPDGYWSIISLQTDTHMRNRHPLFLCVIINKLMTLLYFLVLSVVGGSPLWSSAPLNSGCGTVL